MAAIIQKSVSCQVRIDYTSDVYPPPKEWPKNWQQQLIQKYLFVQPEFDDDSQEIIFKNGTYKTGKQSYRVLEVSFRPSRAYVHMNAPTSICERFLKQALSSLKIGYSGLQENEARRGYATYSQIASAPNLSLFFAPALTKFFSHSLGKYFASPKFNLLVHPNMIVYKFIKLPKKTDSLTDFSDSKVLDFKIGYESGTDFEKNTLSIFSELNYDAHSKLIQEMFHSVASNSES